MVFKSKECFPDFILSIIESHDIICISESKLSDTDIVDIKGYTAFYKNRSKFKRKLGGILLLVKDCFLSFITVFEEERFKCKIDQSVINNYSFVKNTLSKNALIFSVNNKLLNLNTLFFATYIEPENSPYFNKNAFEEIQTVVSNFNFDSVCLLGDFNSIGPPNYPIV